MTIAEQLIRMAEDELTEYSTDARKIEKLRRKFSFAVPYPKQKAVREEVAASLPNNFLAQLVEENRQTVALPFWGIGGLGLLLGISGRQPLDLIATGIGFYVAFQVQKWGWELQAKRLVLQTLDEIETSVQNPEPETAP
ncbi:hypothetical protein [Nodosilinea sp. E11]|uniref:hypothetical protein n=1 Tax=Nodosilinea sp. E11 TaxID=3037479 RepID=UPI0029348700|nr:hypothetical protein [Nodosilinea sp. E11]WOD38050.1 hypothetical protein RRF56_17705 [Nodosilinea sp. E11]